jgi:hypothetical protein
MRERPILIAYRRFEQLQELLFARGYLIDPGGVTRTSGATIHPWGWCG